MIYTGNWIDGKQLGFSTEIWADGSTFEGIFGKEKKWEI
jgi:hypothetical protein